MSKTIAIEYIKEYYPRHYADKTVDPAILEIAERCSTVTSKEDIWKIIDSRKKTWTHEYITKSIWNKFIGWGFPSKIVCESVYRCYQNHIKTNPNAKIIDLGAGSGIFSYMFHQMGISKDRLIALDLENPTHRSKYTRDFWDIKTEYYFSSHDILFISWGTNVLNDIDNFIEMGGKCILILGETDTGCTFPCDYFKEEKDGKTEKNKNWIVEMIHVPGPASEYTEFLSINQKSKK